MNKFTNRVFILLLTFVLLFSLTCFADENALENNSLQDSQNELTAEKAKEYFEQSLHLIMSRYKFDITTDEIYKATIYKMIEENPEIIYDIFSGMFNSLDKYSTYYTDDEYKSFLDGINGEFCGIGVLITSIDNGLLINNVFENSPAMDVGLEIGDIITKVGEISLAGVDVNVAQGYILGEPGTAVNLTIMRNSVEFQVNPVRRNVTVSSGFYQSLENDTIGYIYITQFDTHIAEFAKGALNYFDAKNINNVIIDLRDNPGGSLSGMIEFSNLFIPEGPVINLEYKNPFRNMVYYSYNHTPKYNLIVLTNENSASASEAFAAAVKDSGVGITLGTKTFGKGTMQNMIDFKIGGGIKLTEAEFLSPNMNKINGVGVTPDVKVDDKEVPYEKSGFMPITYNRVLKVGDTGDDVMAIEQRYYTLGLSVGIPDGIYDNKTHTATINFQKSTGLYPYGVTDITTQLKIEEILNGKDVVLNTSLDRAVEIFKNENWESYKSSQENID